MSFVAQLFRKKMPDTADRENRLESVLDAWDLSLMGVGAIIGTGIFVLTGLAAATQAGPAVILSFIVSGVACGFAALAYAELSASVGGCGSAYGYSYAAFGEVIAWIIGWDLILEYGVAVATVANGWSGYFNNALMVIGHPLPEFLTRGPVDGGLVNLPAATIILALMFFLVRGVKDSVRLNTAMVFVKLLTITVFFVVGIFHVNPANWDPFMPFGWFQKLPDGKTVGVLAGASLVFFAYVGFDAVSTAVEESKDPERTVPIGILVSLVFCTLVYIAVSAVLTGIVPYAELNVSSPVAFALHKIGINWASALVATGVITGLTTVMLVLYYGLTRIVLAMGRDGLMPQLFSRVSKKTHTPVMNTVLCGFGMAAAAGFVPLGALAELVNVGTLAAFVLVCGGVIMLRLRYPNMKRPFKAPGGLIIPIMGMVSCGALIAFLPLITHVRFVLWLLVGIVIYFAYSYHHSHLSKK
jgi:APA family basic amino acid/polyamine antiporter